MKTNSTALELRSRGGGGSCRIEERAGAGGPKLKGRGIPYDEWSEDLGGFRERISPGAFRESIRDGDIRALGNHDSNLVLGRTSTGTLRLFDRRDGIHYEVDLNADDADAMSLAARVRRGDISANSFGFVADEDRWEERDGMMWRTIKRATLRELGPQTFPAYPTSDVSVRSIADVLEQGRRCVGRSCPKRDDGLLDLRQRRVELQREDGLREVRRLRTGLDQEGREWVRRQREVLAREELRELRRDLRASRRQEQALRSQDPHLLGMAAHEAAHAVVGFVEGTGIRRLNLRYERLRSTDRDPQYTGGRCSFIGTPSYRATMAGLVGARLRTGDPNAAGGKAWSRKDIASVPERVREEAEAGAERILRREARAHRALTEELMCAGELDGEEVEAVLRRHLTVSAAA